MNRSKLIGKKFGRRAHIYESQAQLQKNIAEKLASFLPDESYDRILEIGCGTGFLTEYLCSKYPKSHKDITDISPEMVCICQDKFQDEDNVSFYVQDAQVLDDVGTYDLIVSSMTVQWFENASEILKKWSEKTNVFYASLGENNFQEWRAFLKNENLPFGGITPQNMPGIFHEDHKPERYGSVYDFLSSMKDIGAGHSKRGYIPLSPRELKTTIARFDAQEDKTITWHIIYGKL